MLIHAWLKLHNKTRQILRNSDRVLALALANQPPLKAQHPRPPPPFTGKTLVCVLKSPQNPPPPPGDLSRVCSNMFRCNKRTQHQVSFVSNILRLYFSNEQKVTEMNG